MRLIGLVLYLLLVLVVITAALTCGALGLAWALGLVIARLVEPGTTLIVATILLLASIHLWLKLLGAMERLQEDLEDQAEATAAEGSTEAKSASESPIVIIPPNFPLTGLTSKARRRKRK